MPIGTCAVPVKFSMLPCVVAGSIVKLDTLSRLAPVFSLMNSTRFRAISRVLSSPLSRGIESRSVISISDELCARLDSLLEFNQRLFEIVDEALHTRYSASAGDDAEVEAVVVTD